MTTTLSEGVKVPDVGSVNWAGDLEVNWNLLNGALANLSFNVKLDRDNTWTGEQSFTLPIVGSITGTASKAIADEDGTSIKTGYVNVAGNQTVSGNKTWSGINTFNQSVIIAGQSGILWDRKSYTAGTLPTSTMYYGFQNAYESGGSVFDRIRSYVSTTGTNLSEHVKYAWSDLTKYASVTFWVSADGSDSEYKYNTSRVIPATNNAVTLGSSSYQWSSVYAQTYYYNGTAWGLDKSNVWTGENTFVSGFSKRNNAMTLGTTPANTLYNSLFFKDKNDTLLASLDQQFNTDGSAHFVLRIAPNQSGASRVGAWEYIHDGTNRTMTFNATLYPVSGDHSLGTSTNKWKTLNGINPGALSLPKNSNSASYNIDTTNWTTDGSIILYTPLLDGWLYINARNDDTNGDSFIIFDDGVSSFGTSVFGNKGLANSGVGLLCLMMPVNKNNGVNIRIKSPGIVSARLYPCNGNV